MKIDDIFLKLEELCLKQKKCNGKVLGFSAIDIAREFNIHRSNISGALNKLYKDNKIEKIPGRPVLYKIHDSDLREIDENKDIFNKIIGSEHSLKNIIQQAKAAIMYPPKGLHTLLLGETGTGKSMFAETMYNYAKDIGILKKEAPFIAFNCADYFNNPQLLVSHLFGVRKGAYTGAEKDKIGIVEQADNGVLFLDEIHRLPPEGQEMLFYLIDKGLYQRLGESDIQRQVKVFIICATTENVESSLLKTFVRRIPMIIKLPALKERSYEERYELITYFFNEEVKGIKSDISITSEVMKALLLYDCTNNIGQLKSDIKLCCAKGFFNSMINKEEKIFLNIEDLPFYVKSGLLKLKKESMKIYNLIGEDPIIFTTDLVRKEVINSKESFNFYDFLEKRREQLKDSDFKEVDINMMIELDIEKYFKNYISKIEEKNFQELYKVVEKEVVDVVQEFLTYAQEKLNRYFENKILYGLSLHISSCIKRISEGKEIKNYQLENIKRDYSKEYEISKKLRELIKSRFSVQLPEDEIGFITMFLCMESEPIDREGRVIVIVAMHGESAASSIADVTNRLLGENHALSYNMPLDQKPEVAFRNLIDMILDKEEGKGVILMVDMGSLALFGDMIYEETKIPIKTVEMVSTPLVLEATRKALLHSSLEHIYDSVISVTPYGKNIEIKSFHINRYSNENVIVTACITGEGAAVKLKSIIEKDFSLRSKNIDVICIDIVNKREFKKKLNRISIDKNIIAVVSAIDPEEEELLYISTTELFDINKKVILDKKKDMIDNLVKTINMKEVIENNINIDARKYINTFKHFYLNLINAGIYVEGDVLIGLILHIACAIEALLRGDKTYRTPNKDKLIKENQQLLKHIKASIVVIEKEFLLCFSEDELINILKIISV